MFLFLGAYDPKEYGVADILKVCFVNNDTLLMDEENQIHGFQTILDFRYGTRCQKVLYLFRVKFKR